MSGVTFISAAIGPWKADTLWRTALYVAVAAAVAATYGVVYEHKRAANAV